MRGPGETQIETDRRIIQDKISKLKEQLKKVDKQMASQRGNRGSLVRISLVGYTNVGKSTLMNLLAKSDVFAENKLFATLDTTVRKVVIENVPFLLSDTVGFIRKLPHQLVEAFKATLEELEYADLLLHVIDSADPDRQEHIEVVNKLIAKLAKPGTRVLECYNKADLVSPEDIPVGEDIVKISAKKGEGMEDLLKAIEKALGHSRHHIVVTLPYSMGGLVETLHSGAQVLNVEYTGEGIVVETIVDPILYGRLKEYITDTIDN